MDDIISIVVVTLCNFPKWTTLIHGYICILGVIIIIWLLFQISYMFILLIICSYWLFFFCWHVVFICLKFASLVHKVFFLVLKHLSYFSEPVLKSLKAKTEDMKYSGINTRIFKNTRIYFFLNKRTYTHFDHKISKYIQFGQTYKKLRYMM